jgi:hypothetical protein
MTHEPDPTQWKGMEMGYRLAIRDLEKWVDGIRTRPNPELIPGITRAIDKLSIRADDYWPPEENT